MGKITSHDVDEVLQEQQSGSHSKSFGEIAITWGLCQPEHIWKAWASQLSDGFDQVDLQSFGIDAQAVCQFSQSLSQQFNAIGIRLLDDTLIIAVSTIETIPLLEHFCQHLHRRMKFVISEPSQIRQMIKKYYGADSAINRTPETAAA